MLWPYFLLAAFTQVIWGLTPSASKLALDFLPVEIYGAVRYSAAALVFFAVAWLTRKPMPRSLGDALRIMGIGAIAYGAASSGTLYGLKIGGVLNLALASSLNAPIAAIVTVIGLSEKPGRFFLPAMVASAAGGFLLFLGKSDISGFRVGATSLLLLWAAYVCDAVGLVGYRRFSSRYSAVTFLAFGQMGGAIVFWTSALVKGQTLAPMANLTPLAWGAVVYATLISCCLCFFLLYWLAHHIEPHKLVFFDGFHTMAAVALGYVFFREPFTPLMLLGGVLLFGAVTLLHLPSGRRDGSHGSLESLEDLGGEQEVPRRAGVEG